MSVAIASTESIAAKFARVTPQRTQDFIEGVTSPRRDWKTETAAAESRYEAGVTEAIRGKRFGKGVAKAGTDKWQRKTLEVGPARWAEGVAAAEEAYRQGFAPYQAVIAALSLPQRWARGDKRNIERVAKVADALHAKKVSG